MRPDNESPAVPALSRGWLAGTCVLVVLASALAAGSFVNSFSAVRDAVEPSFGGLAWTVPVLIDVGVGVRPATRPRDLLDLVHG
jgi:hypothetical protein